MNSMRTLLLGGLGALALGGPCVAADYYVKPQTPGPVTGTPLAPVQLQAETSGAGFSSAWIPDQTTATDEQASAGAADTSPGAKHINLRLRGLAMPDREGVGEWVSLPSRAKGSRWRNSEGGGMIGTATTTTSATDSGTAVLPGSTSEGGVTTGTTSEGGTTSSGTSEGGATTGTTSERETTSSGTSEGATSTGSGGTTSTGTTSTGTSTSTGTTTTTTPTTTTSTTTTSTTTTSTGTPPTGTSPQAGQTFASFGALLSSGKLQGGDRVFLMDGYHGPLLIKGQKFTTPVLIAPVPGQTAQVDAITITGSSNIAISGLKVWATSANAGNGALIRTYADTSDIWLTGLDVRAVADSGNYMSWSKATWLNNQRLGFQTDGNRVTVARNRITGIYHGIVSFGPNALIEENIVDGFSGDGMRALGDNSIVRRNKVQNCFQINSNHADAFQSWSRGPGGKPGTGTLQGLLVEENKFLEWTSSQSNPLRCNLQGVGMFDGMYNNVTIRNNVIVVSAYHGINIAGAENSVVVNNTVVHPNGVSGKYPWIKISYHKSGKPSHDVKVANNLTMNLNNTKSDPTRNILVTNNIFLSSASREFTDFANLDLTLRSTSTAVDAGTAQLAPATDIDGNPRPLGRAPDAGAYESH